MSKLSKILLGLAALQVALAVIIYSSERGSARQAKRWLSDFSPGAVTAIEVATRPMDIVKDGVASTVPGDTVALSKQAQGWQISSSFGYPADAAKVDQLLAALKDAEASAPLTTDPARHADLRVADAQYDRKLTLTMGERTVTVYIGLSAGQTASVRLAGNNDVYESTRITPWSAAGDARGWMNTAYAQHDPLALRALEVANQHGTWRFDRSSGDWAVSLEGMPVVAPAGGILDLELIRQLPNRAATLTAVAPADAAANASPDGSPTTTLRVFLANQPAPVVYTVFGVGKRYFVRDQARPHAVFVPREQLVDLIDVSPSALVKRN